MRNRSTRQPHRTGCRGTRNEAKTHPNTPTIVTAQLSTVPTQPQHAGGHQARTVPSIEPETLSTAPSRHRQQWCPDTTNDSQQQQQQVTALTTEAVHSQDDHKRDQHRHVGSCNTPDTPSDTQMIASQTSTHSSIMDVDATNDPTRQQSAPLTLPSGLDIQDDTMQLDNDPVRDSVQRVLRLAAEAPAPQRNTWCLYGALDAAQRRIAWAADGDLEPRAYAQQLR